MKLEFNTDGGNFFKQVCPVLIAAVVKAATKLVVHDGWVNNLNEIAADEIEKAGAIIENLYIKSIGCFIRLLANAKFVEYKIVSSRQSLKNEVKTYTQFPHLKVLHCAKYQVSVAILARSQLAEFSSDSKVLTDILP